MPAKAPPEAVTGLNTYGGSQTIPQATHLPGNYQGSGQTVGPHMGPSPVAPPPTSASAPRIPPPIQNYGFPTTIVSGVTHATQPTESNWQYFPTPLSHAQSLTNHAPSTTGMILGSSLHYGPPFGGPPLQNNFITSGKIWST